MFRVVVLILLVTLIPNPLHADDKALEILEKAIAAHTGKGGKLEKLRMAIISQKGVIFTPAGEMATTRKIMTDAPRKTRIRLGRVAR